MSKISAKKISSAFCLTYSLTCLLAYSAFAGGIGTTGAQFLKIGQGARPAAMGGAFSSVADDINAIYWNPSGLAQQEKRQGSASYIQHFQGVNIGFLGYSQKISSRGTMGIGLNYLSVGGMERRTTDTDASIESFGASDMALYLSYADRKLLSEKIKGLTLGANLKVIRQTIDTQTSQSFALDIGALYKTPVEKLTASFGIYNLGSSVKFVDESDPLPLDVRLGASYRLLNDSLLIACDIDDLVYDERITEAVGLEYMFKKALSVRAGYKLGTDSAKLGGLAGFSAGLGVNVWGIALDYAFVPFGELDNTNQISISTKF